MIEYTVEVYFDKFRDKLSHKREIEVREFLFTEEELDADWKAYEKIINIKNVLRPTTNFASRFSMDEEMKRKEAMKYNLAMKA